MDITQVVIVISLLLITGIFVATGVWIISILKELKVTVRKFNLVLDDTHDITASVSRPISSISEFVMGFKNGLEIFNKFFPKEVKKEK